MEPMARFLLLAHILFLLAGASQGLCAERPVIIQADLFADPSRELRIEDVVKPGFADRFVPIVFPASLGKDQSAYWVRLRVRFPNDSRTTKWALDLNWDYLRSLSCYTAGPVPAAFFVSGDWNVHVDSAIPLPAPHQELAEYYVRLIGYGGLNLNPEILTERASLERARIGDRLLWAFFGILFAMFVYNAFIYFFLKDVSYLWYILHIAFSTWYYVFSNGFAPGIPGESPGFVFFTQIKLFIVNTAFMFLTITMFTRSFLRTKGERPRLDMILRIQTYLCGGFAVLSILIHPVSALTIGPFLGVTTSFTVLFCSLARLFQGFKPAAVFVPGWLVYITFGMIHSMTWMGVVPANTLTVYGPEIGSAVEVLVMSLALAYRVRTLQKEKEATEREKIMLAENSALFTLLLDHSKLGIGLVKDGVFSWANNALQAMAGKNGRLKGTPLGDIDGFETLLDAGTPGPAGEGLVREGAVTVNGASRELRALGQPVDLPASEHGAVWVIEDVSEQKRLERFREDLDQIARHDLKSPLAAIRGLQSAVEEAGPLTREQKRALDMIGRSANQGLQSLTTALALYRIEAGKFARGASTTDLLVAIAGAINELAPYQRSEGKTVRVGAEGSLECACAVQGEKELVHTVLVNLLKNALEALPPGGEANVVIAAESSFIRVRIANPGAIPLEIRDRFFEKFATSGKKKGSGLGAYSARAIARALGGDATLDQAEGVVTVTVSFVKA